MTLPPVVLDNGTSTLKCGCAGVSPLPLFVCPTVVGRPSTRVTTPESSLFSSRTHWHTRGSYPPVSCAEVDVSSRNDGPISTASRGKRASLLWHGDVRWCCGNETRGVGGETLDLTYPIRNGVVRDLEAMQNMWRYALCEQLPQILAAGGVSMHANTSGNNEEATADDTSAFLDGRRLFLSEPPNATLRQRTDIIEAFFESYHLEGLELTPQSLLALFANGAEQGVVVECGAGVTYCTSVLEGQVHSRAQRRLDLAGQAVTQHLEALLRRRGDSTGAAGATGRGEEKADANSFLSSLSSMSSLCRHAPPPAIHEEDGVTRRLKERYCYVAADAEAEKHLAHNTAALQRCCVLPDGTRCHLNDERFVAPEVLFRPSLLHVEAAGLSQTVWDAIEATDMDARTSLYENILLSGGTTLLPGFRARLESDMRDLYLCEKLKGDVRRMSRCPIRVTAPPRRQYMVYVGAALLAEVVANQPEMWLSRSDYDEGGASAIAARYGSR